MKVQKGCIALYKKEYIPQFRNDMSHLSMLTTESKKTVLTLNISDR